MKRTDAVAHCDRLLERATAEFEKHDGLGYMAERLRQRVATLKAIRAAHLAAQRRPEAA